MTRSISPALAIFLFALPISAQQRDLPGDGKVTTDGLPPELVGTDESAQDEVAEEDLEMEMEMAFCGGGEETVVDLAYYVLMADEVVEAEVMLVEALRAGQVEAWQRVHALVTLADAQLRLGKHWAAARNYRRALDVDEENAGLSARVGLASALYLQHRRRAAIGVAREAATAACASRYAETECYAARMLVAGSSRQAGEREEATEAALRLRESHADRAESFDLVDRRLGLRDAIVVAAR